MREAQNSLLVEMERLPTCYFEHSRDWSDLAISRVLAQPLFFELPERCLSSSFVRNLRRVDDLTWHLDLTAPVANSAEGHSPAAAVCSQIQEARKCGAAPALAASIFKSLRLLSDERLEVETRFPLAHPDRVLANPALTPHKLAGVHRYSVVSRTSAKILLQPTTAGRSIELMEAGQESLDAGLDHCIRGPMALGPGAFNSQARVGDHRFDLDICYALLCPPSLPEGLVPLIETHLDRKTIVQTLDGICIPCARLTDTWTPSVGAPRVATPKGYRQVPHLSGTLRYSAFPGNAELAASLSAALNEQFGLELCQQAVSNELLIASSTELRDGNEFRLVLVASPWPHPLGFLAAYYFSRNSSDGFKAAFRAAAREENMDDASALTSSAEEILVKDGRSLIVIGRAQGRVWPVPPTFF